ncbi:MAG: acetyl-CoA acetyltransferase, partial [Deltaproteobacteria bacterium]|nr:acetyl-CoA acetyltransferase [Deltaproteobacteria bacterium]
MGEGIKNKVAIIGMGCTKFGEHWDKDSEDLIVEAFTEAIEDAGIEKKDIQAVWYGSCYEELNVGKSALFLSRTLKLPFIPVTRVENLCASGSEALRGAVYGVASGACDIALALGAEKLKDTGYGGLSELSTILGTKNRVIFPAISAPGAFAMMANRYFSKYGMSTEEGKRSLAKISVNSHRNGAKNPKAHLQKVITEEDVLNAPIIASPLGLLDCCGVSDGAAAAIVCRADMAKNFISDPVFVKALQIGISSGEELGYSAWDGTYVETTTRTAARAYQEAGIKDPREEISMMELHDC